MIPQIPRYAPNLKTPVMCNSCGQNVFPIVDPAPSSGKDVFVIAGPGIEVDDLSDANAWRYRVTRQEYIALTVALSLVAKEAGSPVANPVLRGTVIDRIELSWAYNKTISTQALTNNAGFAQPSLIPGDVSKIYTGAVLQTNASFTITGNDGQGVTGSIASDTKSIIFGDSMYIGKGASRLGTDISGLQGFIQSLSKTTESARTKTFYATGGANEMCFVAYPKLFGLGTFTKGIFTGGFVRLKLVGTTIKSELTGSDVESDIVITNTKGYAQPYYVYQSLFDDQNDPVTPFIIS